jgi:antitoxin (DNA-binding transcriptional repressor) of toxin-antitoxin stability system
MTIFDNQPMQKINASKFKEQCLALLDNLDPEGIVITKHGKAVARLIPAGSDCASLIGSMKDKVKIHGNLLSTGIEWDAES